MKRFWREVTLAEVAGGWQVLLDGRAVRTQGGTAQIVPGHALAEALAAEWAAQGEVVDPQSFPMRDLVDLALDHVAPDLAAHAAKLMRYAETDTLLYRADPDEPLHRRQLEEWEPLVQSVERRHGITFERVSGIIHRPQPAATLETLRHALLQQDAWRLAAIATLAPLAASLIVALNALEENAAAEHLFAAANLEEDWQTEQWGSDADAAQVRAAREAAFAAAMRLVRLA
ncbi:molecular chaperone [Croceibacterium mercuriale]|uniref:Molecular chaperone n=1 Tax=Croceibacterium mercuriale TaxID=1572751 RepID=A0A0B2BZ61_9SPHN|nr:ATP12 family protein [Croceibacterium mercuriale]KHL25292.1 molecular chaperone [Croceibacterium mercuriale]